VGPESFGFEELLGVVDMALWRKAEVMPVWLMSPLPRGKRYRIPLVAVFKTPWMSSETPRI
jgi:hypothetical protein